MMTKLIEKVVSIRRTSHPDIGPIRRVIINNGVGRTLFSDFSRESLSSNGFCETGWLLCGIRRPNEVVITASISAGPKAQRWEHGISFDKEHLGESVKRLVRLHPGNLPLGIAHTHPYRCIRPSGTDYSGDSEWVKILKGKEGVFAIGVAGRGDIETGVIRRCDMEMHWYILGEDDLEYRRVPCSYRWGHDLGLEVQRK